MSFKIKLNFLRTNKSFFFLLGDKQKFYVWGNLMSKKLIEFLAHFSDCSYKVITCFYVEICAIYQISILRKLLAEMKVPVRIISENSSMAR